jgi:hypothetical protein
MPTPTAPALAVVAWRTAILVALVAYAAAATVVCRGLVGGFGGAPVPWAVVAAAAAVAMLAVLPMGAAIDVPEAMFEHWLPERRFRAGRCPCCGYDASRARCPECGAAFERPVPYASDWRTLRRTAWAAVPAWIVGLGAGIALVTLDERRFEREIASYRALHPELREHSRPRASPAGFARLGWDVGRGFSGPPPFESPKSPIQSPIQSPVQSPVQPPDFGPGGAKRSTNSGLSTK